MRSLVYFYFILANVKSNKLNMIVYIPFPVLKGFFFTSVVTFRTYLTKKWEPGNLIKKLRGKC